MQTNQTHIEELDKTVYMIRRVLLPHYYVARETQKFNSPFSHWLVSQDEELIKKWVRAYLPVESKFLDDGANWAAALWMCSTEIQN